MALINCPECGKEISDKSKACIHCGYPIENNEQERLFSMILVSIRKNPYEYSASSDLYGIPENEFKALIRTPGSTLITGIKQSNVDYLRKDFKILGYTVDFIPDKGGILNPLNEKWDIYARRMAQAVVCPRCGSNQITTGQRGFSIWTGFLGSNKTMNRCAKCGHSWQPK